MPYLDPVFFISPDATIQEAVRSIDRNGKAIVLVTDPERHLLGTITDGDIRRAILAGVDLQAPLSMLIQIKENSRYPIPVTMKEGTDTAEIFQLMRERVIRNIPILDGENRVVDMVSLEDLLPVQELPLRAVIMAGGLGSRLRPLTEDLPKPMLPVGNKPLMEITIDRLKQAGIQDVLVTTYHRGECIKDYFGDGSKFGIRLGYIDEEKYPLGTAGALGLLPPQERTMLVINGDVLTTTNYEAMYNFHKKNQAVATIAVRQYILKVPYGVVECEGYLFRGLQEKPTIPLLVNAGIYLLEPSVLKLIGYSECLDMPTLIRRLKEREETVVVFPIIEQWLDIGDHQAYRQAQMEEAEREQIS